MDPNGLRARILRREVLGGIFVKTPAYDIIEVLALSGLDFICLDAEHAPLDRRGMDSCLAMAKALGLPCLVRVPEGTPAQILMALDSGAAGVVVPHVDSAEKASAIAQAAHFGEGGRGFAGSTRWAGLATKTMPDVLAMDDETIVLAQIEETAGVAALDAIAGTAGIDGLFVGPADMAVALGKTSIDDPAVHDVMKAVGDAAARAGKAAVTFWPTTAAVDTLKGHGMSMFFIASEHALMLSAARQVAADMAAKK